MEFLVKFIKEFIIFSRNTIGSINSPYATFRRLSSTTSDLGQVFFIWFLVLLYFAFTSLVKNGTANPYLLTYKFNILFFSTAVTFAGIIFLLFLLAKIVGAKTNIKTLIILWSYTLFPTLVWFFLTSLFYLILPPPRSLTMLGKIFSLFFIFLSSILFFWKIILYYLTLRFGLKLGLYKIGVISIFTGPFVCLYAIIMYQMGIFRIPFI